MLDYVVKKPLGEYTLNEIINICDNKIINIYDNKKKFCDSCPLSSLCSTVNIPHIKHFYKKELEEIIYFNSETGETDKEDIDETN